jgi:prophage regulatory protein
MSNKYRKGIAMSMYQTILRLALVKQRTGLSRSSIYSGVKQGTFPAQISLGPRAVGWLESSIDEWIQSRIELSAKAEA